MTYFLYRIRIRPCPDSLPSARFFEKYSPMSGSALPDRSREEPRISASSLVASAALSGFAPPYPVAQQPQIAAQHYDGVEGPSDESMASMDITRASVTPLSRRVSTVAGERSMKKPSSRSTISHDSLPWKQSSMAWP